jgi:hypothetical protein
MNEPKVYVEMNDSLAYASLLGVNAVAFTAKMGFNELSGVTRGLHPDVRLEFEAARTALSRLNQACKKHANIHLDRLEKSTIQAIQDQFNNDQGSKN